MMQTNNKRPLILVTNDDGIKAGGLVALVKLLRECGDVVVVVPDQSYSGMSHAITVQTPLYAKVVREEQGLLVYKVNGTPVDCVKLALKKLMPVQPDFIFSGINHGSNSSISIHYSGTMGAAREGSLAHIPSVGLSLLNYKYDADFSQAVICAKQVVDYVLENGLPKGVFLNINVPDVATVKGLKVMRQSAGQWVEDFVEREDPRGRKYYWLSGHFNNLEPEATDTDEYALANGYASVVPCYIDSTHHESIQTLKSLNHEL